MIDVTRRKLGEESYCGFSDQETYPLTLKTGEQKTGDRQVRIDTWSLKKKILTLRISRGQRRQENPNISGSLGIYLFCHWSSLRSSCLKPGVSRVSTMEERTPKG